MALKLTRRMHKALVSVGTLTALSIPVVLFCSFQMQHLYNNLGYGPPVAVLCIYVLAVVQLFVVICSNPGLLDKRHFPAHDYNHLTGLKRHTAPPRFLEILINGQVIRTKYCVSCHMYRPPRTVHCSSCGGCVLRYDHHCPYVSNCIGFNNYRKFYFFVASCCLYYLTMLTVSVYRFSGFFPEIWVSFETAPAASACTILSIIVSLIVAWLVVGLCCFHVLVVFKSQSTYDRMKGNYMDFNPFYRGYRLSLREAMLTRSRLLAFVKPFSPRYNAKQLFQPGAMFASMEQRENVLQQDEAFIHNEDWRWLSTHEKNTLRYIKTFGQTETATLPTLSLGNVVSLSSNEDTVQHVNGSAV